MGSPGVDRDDRVRVSREAARARVHDRRPVDLLEKGRGLGAQTVLGEERLGVGAERRIGIPERGHPREISRGEEMRQAGLFEERRAKVRGRITLETWDSSWLQSLSHAARYHEAVPYTDIRVRYARSGPVRRGRRLRPLLDAGLSPPRPQPRPRLRTPARRRSWASRSSSTRGCGSTTRGRARRHASLHPRGHAGQSRGARRGSGSPTGPSWRRSRGSGRGLVARLAERAVARRHRRFPLLHRAPDQTRGAGPRRPRFPSSRWTATRIVPLVAPGGPAVAAAAHLRPRIHKAFAEAWEHRATRRAPRFPRWPPSRARPPFAPRTCDDRRRPSAPRCPSTDRSPRSRRCPAARAAARRRLRRIPRPRLAGYAESPVASPRRPRRPAPSGLEPVPPLRPHLHRGGRGGALSSHRSVDAR